MPILVELTDRMPDNTLVWRELGRIYAIKGRIEDSRRAYDQVESLSP
jgi:DNA-binding SARP family transcriptional activator